jgi:hypothetical protein
LSGLERFLLYPALYRGTRSLSPGEAIGDAQRHAQKVGFAGSPMAARSETLTEALKQKAREKKP